MKISDDKYEAKLTANYLLGIVAGLDQAAGMMKEHSGISFANGDDRKANFCREYDKKFSELSVEARKQFDKHNAEADAMK